MFATGKENKKISVYPNPGQTVFTVNTNSLSKEITIVDVVGKNKLSLKPSDTIVNMDLSNLENGIYYVKVRKGSEVEILKIVKQE